MISEYRSGKSQLRKYIFFPLLKLLAVILVTTIISLILFRVSREHVLRVVALTWSWVGLIHLMPLLIMGIRHRKLSKRAYFSINTASNQCQYREKDMEFYFSLNEIDKVVKVVSPPKYDKRMDILGFGYFFYWKIIFLDGRTLFISCMLLDVDNFFEKKESQEKQLFPIPPSNNGVP